MLTTRTPNTYWGLVFGLLGHLFGTAVIFASLFTIGWAVSFFLHFLHNVHAFPEQILLVITTLELYLVYGDSALCLIVLIAGAFRFCKHIIEVDNEKRAY